jgi:UDP-3-O-[3-hydroxymyristoyl] glucosamine N-acyltransferase
MLLKELAERLGAQLQGDGNVEITGVGTLDDATPSQVSFLANRRYANKLRTTRAGAVCVAPNTADDRLNLLKVKDPYFAFQQAVVLLVGHRKHPFTGIHPQAFVDPTATVGQGSVLYPFSYVGPRARLGRDCILYPGACVYDDCVLGDRVILQANAVVGMDGYGFATHDGVHHKIPQVGNAVLEDDVELGAGANVARAMTGSTVIGKGSKLGDLVTVGHNAKIGPHALLVAQVGIAGSTVIGHHATFAGQVGVAGHLTIGDNVTVGGQGGVTGDVESGAILLGSPAIPYQQARRAYTALGNLPELIERVRELERQVEKLRQSQR